MVVHIHCGRSAAVRSVYRVMSKGIVHGISEKNIDQERLRQYCENFRRIRGVIVFLHDRGWYRK